MPARQAFKWRDSGGRWRDWSGHFTSAPTRKVDLRQYPRVESKPGYVRRPTWRAPVAEAKPAADRIMPAPKIIAGEVTPKQATDQFANAVRRARTRKVPEIAAPKAGRTVRLDKFSSKGVQLVGDALARSKALSMIQQLKPGTRIRVKVRGKAGDVKLDARENRREFILGQTAKGVLFKGGKNFAGQLLHHMFGALGKEFFDARGRGYNMIDPDDTIEWIVEVVG